MIKTVNLNKLFRIEEVDSFAHRVVNLFDGKVVNVEHRVGILE